MDFFDTALHDQCPRKWSAAFPEPSNTPLNKHTQYTPPNRLFHLQDMTLDVAAHLETNFSDDRTIRSQRAYVIIDMSGLRTRKETRSAGILQGDLEKKLPKTKRNPHPYSLELLNNFGNGKATLKVHLINRDTPLFEQFKTVQNTLETLMAEYKAADMEASGTPPETTPETANGRSKPRFRRDRNGHGHGGRG